MKESTYELCVDIPLFGLQIFLAVLLIYYGVTVNIVLLFVFFAFPVFYPIDKSAIDDFKAIRQVERELEKQKIETLKN